MPCNVGREYGSDGQHVAAPAGALVAIRHASDDGSSSVGGGVVQSRGQHGVKREANSHAACVVERRLMRRCMRWDGTQQIRKVHAEGGGAR
jgi:hypothetical protein